MVSIPSSIATPRSTASASCSRCATKVCGTRWLGLVRARAPARRTLPSLMLWCGGRSVSSVRCPTPEDQWIDVVISMVESLREDHPMSSVLICFLLDTFALPTSEAIDALNHKLIKRVKRGKARPGHASPLVSACARSPRTGRARLRRGRRYTGSLDSQVARNIAIVWSIYAEKIVGVWPVWARWWPTSTGALT